MLPRIYFIRHGETEWSVSGQHTGRTDIPLNEAGKEGARRLAPRLQDLPIDRVLTSPLSRAQLTCRLAGLGDRAEVEPDLIEWDYGAYESKRTVEIRKDRPGWNLFYDGCPGGESPAQVCARADRLIARLRKLGGATAVFSHGHFGRALAARWTNLPIAEGQRLLLSPTTLSILDFEHQCLEEPVIALWNSA